MTDQPISARLWECPFCAAGETRIEGQGRTWRGTGGYSEPTSYKLTHWCIPVQGQPHQRSISFVARDEASATTAWNTRVESTASACPSAKVLTQNQRSNRLESHESLAGVDTACPSGAGVDTLVDDASFQRAIDSLGEPDDVFNRWFLDEGNLRYFAARLSPHKEQLMVSEIEEENQQAARSVP